MPTVTFSLHGEGTGVRQDIDVIGSDHVIAVDAYKSFGGDDAHPSPLAYTLASLISCTQVTSQVVARGLGITLESFTFDVSADLDTAVMVKGATDGDPTFQNVRIQAEVATAASPEQFAELQRETERRCPVSALFRRADVRVTNTWTQLVAQPVG